VRPKIYSGKKPVIEEPVQFRLMDLAGYDGIQLVAVNEDGENIGAGVVLSITPGGVVELAQHEIPGLQTTKNGYVTVTRN